MAYLDHEDAEVGSAAEYRAPVCGQPLQDRIQLIRGDAAVDTLYP